MITTREMISDWFDQGVRQGAQYMIVAIDTFGGEAYPVWTGADDFWAEHNKRNGQNMTRIEEVYDLRRDKQTQLSEFRAHHPPPSLGAQYLERMTEPRVLTEEDQEKIARLLDWPVR